MKPPYRYMESSDVNIYIYKNMNKHFIDISKCFNRHHKPWVCHFIKVTPVSLNTFTRKHLHAAFGLRFDHVS